MSVRRALAVAFLLFLSTAAAVAVQERLVIVGAGFTGSWDTDIELANPGSELIWAWIGQIPRVVPGCLHCPGWDRSVAAGGTTKTNAQEVLTFGTAGVRTLYVDPYDGHDQPTVTARIVNRARPDQAIELPVVRYSTIQALNPSVLAFPAARRSADSHSNLVVSEISRETGAGLSILVEAFSAAGERQGSATFGIPPGGAFSVDNTLFLIDVLQQLGVSELDGGQIRVTKTGGSGLMWGLLATVYDEGRVSVSVGANP
jgi:hypothetical protein